MSGLEEDEFFDIIATQDMKDTPDEEVGPPVYPTNTAVYTKQGWCYYVTTPADDIWSLITDGYSIDVNTKFIRFAVKGADALTAIININEIVSILDLTPAEPTDG